MEADQSNARGDLSIASIMKGEENRTCRRMRHKRGSARFLPVPLIKTGLFIRVCAVLDLMGLTATSPCGLWPRTDHTLLPACIQARPIFCSSLSGTKPRRVETEARPRGIAVLQRAVQTETWPRGARRRCWMSVSRPSHPPAAWRAGRPVSAPMQARQKNMAARNAALRIMAFPENVPSQNHEIKERFSIFLKGVGQCHPSSKSREENRGYARCYWSAA